MSAMQLQPNSNIAWLALMYRWTHQLIKKNSYSWLLDTQSMLYEESKSDILIWLQLNYDEVSTV